MSQEIAVSGYYSSLRNKLNFIDTNLMCKMGLEFFLSTLLFKGDVSRVVYSKESMAFRRRVETLGEGDVKGRDYNYINLNLPYAIYSQTSNIEEDDRGFTQNASQIVKGWQDPDTGIVIKGAACKVTYDATVFFSRRDDINIATQLLYWEKTPKAPLMYMVENKIVGQSVNIPVFISLEDIDSNVEYEEKDWLSKSKIFPLKLKFTIRSYQILIEDFDGYVKLPLRFSGLYAYNDEEVVFTQKTSLIWADKKWSPHAKNHLITLNKNSTIAGEEDVELALKNHLKIDNSSGDAIYINESGNEIKMLNKGDFTREQIDNTVADVVQAYFTEDRDCSLVEYHQKSATDNSVTVEWAITNNEEQFFKEITLYIPGIFNRTYDDANINSVTIEDLCPGSEYDLHIVVISTTKSKVNYSLKLRTTGNKVLGKKLSDNLVGRTFTGL